MAAENSSFNTRASLIMRVKDSYDDESWEEFVHYYRGFICAVSRNLGVIEKDVDDITQQVILKAWKALPEFEYDSSRGRFKNWLAQMTRNVVLTFFRSRQREQNRYDEFEKQSTGVDSEFDQMIEAQWKLAIGEMAWENIKGRFSEDAVKCFEYIKQGYKNKDIAQTLGIDANTVAVYKKRIISSLQKEILKLDSHLS